MFTHKFKPYRGTLLLVSQMLICTAAYSLPVSNTDLWENATITKSSGVLSISDEKNMFGSTFGTMPSENENTLFKDDETHPFTHWVEWMTPNAITLGAFNLVAAHDQEPRDIVYRGVEEFRLYSGDGTGNWSLIYEYNTDPDLDRLYGGGATYTDLNVLELTALVSPVTSQYFRAEFDQAAILDAFGHASGPRITELDGYAPEALSKFSSTIPEPNTLALLFSGLLFFQRRKIGAMLKRL